MESSSKDVEDAVDKPSSERILVSKIGLDSRGIYDLRAQHNLKSHGSIILNRMFMIEL